MNHYTDEQLRQMRSKMSMGDLKFIAQREGITTNYVQMALKGDMNAPQKRPTVRAALDAVVLWLKLKELYVNKQIGCLDDLTKLSS
jgi:hypothetical protein